jgi:hypothetical protein
MVSSGFSLAPYLLSASCLLVNDDFHLFSWPHIIKNSFGYCAALRLTTIYYIYVLLLSMLSLNKVFHFISFHVILHVHVRVACTCPCCMSMSMLRVLAACLCSCCMSMSMTTLHVSVHAASLCPYYVHAAYICTCTQYIRMYRYIYMFSICRCVWICLCICRRISVHIHIPICICIRICICICILCICVCIYVCIYKYCIYKCRNARLPSIWSLVSPVMKKANDFGTGMVPD